MNKTQIDFTKFRLYTGISRKETRPFDVREELANSLYLAGRGIRMHDLAMRIFIPTGPWSSTKRTCNCSGSLHRPSRRHSSTASIRT